MILIFNFKTNSLISKLSYGTFKRQKVVIDVLYLFSSGWNLALSLYLFHSFFLCFLHFCLSLTIWFSQSPRFSVTICPSFFVSFFSQFLFLVPFFIFPPWPDYKCRLAVSLFNIFSWKISNIKVKIF